MDAPTALLLPQGPPVLDKTFGAFLLGTFLGLVYVIVAVGLSEPITDPRLVGCMESLSTKHTDTSGCITTTAS